LSKIEVCTVRAACGLGQVWKLNNVNGLGWAQGLTGQVGLQAKLYPIFAYKRSNYEKLMYAISL